jgi:hypothetical protein
MLLVAVVLSAQDKPVAAPPKKLDEWPALKDTDRDRVLAMAAQFKKDSKLHEAARNGLVGVGEAAMPLLFQQVSDRQEASNEQLFLVFDKVIGPQHAALLARELGKPRVELKRYLVRRLCRFVDPTMAPVLVAASRDKDAQVAITGSIGALALKQKEALPAVLLRAKNDWDSIRELAAEVLPAARSSECGMWAIDCLKDAHPVDRVAALRLLRYLAVKEQAAYLRIYLDAEDHGVKKEAINAMRVLYGQPPMENLSVFQAIEMAKEWKTKA